jgi:hypothetical protein
MEYAKQVSDFFENLRKCDRCNSKDCKYIGTIAERLEKYREIRKKAIADDKIKPF